MKRGKIINEVFLGIELILLIIGSGGFAFSASEGDPNYTYFILLFIGLGILLIVMAKEWVSEFIDKFRG